MFNGTYSLAREKELVILGTVEMQSKRHESTWLNFGICALGRALQSSFRWVVFKGMDCKVAIWRSWSAQFTRGGLGTAKEASEEDCLRRSFTGHPEPPLLSSPAGTAWASSWLVSCRDAHARRLVLGLSWAWTAVLQLLPGSVAVARCGRCACVARLGVAPTAILARGGAWHGGLRGRLGKHGDNGCADSAPLRCRCSSLLFRLWAICVVVWVGRCPTVWVHGPARLAPGAVYTRELAPLGTGCVGALVIAGPTVGSGNACERLNSVRVIGCLLHSG